MAITTVLISAFNGDNADVDDAIAAVAAAVIGVAGTFAGHKAGRHRASPTGLRASGCKRSLIELGEVLVAVSLILVVVLVAGVMAFVLLPKASLSISPAAAATICAAAIGVASVWLAHLLKPSLVERVWQGRILFALALTGGAVLIIQPIGAIRPQDSAAFSAALITIAGTFLAHSTGHSQAHHDVRQTLRQAGSNSTGTASGVVGE